MGSNILYVRLLRYFTEKLFTKFMFLGVIIGKMKDTFLLCLENNVKQLFRELCKSSVNEKEKYA